MKRRSFLGLLAILPLGGLLWLVETKTQDRYVVKTGNKRGQFRQGIKCDFLDLHDGDCFDLFEPNGKLVGDNLIMFGEPYCKDGVWTVQHDQKHQIDYTSIAFQERK